MKRFNGKISVIAATFALVLAMSVMFTGCDDEKAPAESGTTGGTGTLTTEAVSDEIDIDATAESILDGVKFDDTLAKLDGEAVKYRYGLESDIPAAVYAGSGATAEEIAVFDAQTDAEGEKLLELANKYIEDQIVSYKNYVPAEVSRLEKAIVKGDGRYVIVCVTADTDAAEDIIDKVLGK